MDSSQRPAAKIKGVALKSTPLERMAGKRAARLLEMFSASSDRKDSAMSLNTGDAWLNFLISAHLNDSALTSDNLFVWLSENGWPGKKAWQLSHEYKFARSLLNKYGCQK